MVRTNGLGGSDGDTDYSTFEDELDGTPGDCDDGTVEDEDYGIVEVSDMENVGLSEVDDDI
jgi:hypothetical protein